MNAFIICGPGAVGKMTVGQELAKLTGYRLFHNHMTIEPMLDIFGKFDLNFLINFRNLCFDEFSKGDYPGLIFTCMWDFDSEIDKEIIEGIYNKFTLALHQVCFVELIAPLTIRKERNKSENRLKEKKSKRDLAFSENRLLIEEKRRYNSFPNEINYPHLKIDNSDLNPLACAEKIKDFFNI